MRNIEITNLNVPNYKSKVYKSQILTEENKNINHKSSYKTDEMERKITKASLI